MIDPLRSSRHHRRKGWEGLAPAGSREGADRKGWVIPLGCFGVPKVPAPFRLPRISCLFLVFLFLHGASIPRARASYFNTFGVNARGMALGNAMAAISKGWASVYYNPAALALSEEIEFSIGVFSANPDLTTDYLQGPDQDLVQFPRREGGLETITGPSFGLVVPIQRMTPKRLPMPLAIGFGVFLPRQALVTTRVIDETFPFDVVFQERNSTLAFHFGISTRITSAVYIGIGLVSQFVTPVDVQLTETADSPVELTARLSAPSLLAGILFRPAERLRFGLVYRQESKIESRWNAIVQTRIPIGDANNGFSLYRQTILERQYVSGFAPENVSFGGAYKVTERLSITGELTWYRWSDYQGPLGQPLLPSFNNILVPRVGALYRITRKLEARAGFYFEPTPVTNQATGFYPIGNDRFVPSIGVGYTFDAPWGILAKPVNVDGFFQYHILMDEDYNRAVPDNPFIQNPDLTSGGQVFNLGLELTFRF